MERNRFELALSLLRPDQWYEFERLAAEFLVAEFPNLRTTATSSGDRGRDGYLFTAEGDSKTVFQYSLAQEWKPKITKTLNRVPEHFPDMEVLTYVTNQKIGASADQLRGTVRTERGAVLDIRDGTWFAERVSTTPERELAAERICRLTVDPLLEADGIIPRKAKALTTIENKTALVHLGLQLEDDNRSKGLTRLAYEAIARGILRDTDSEHRMPRTEIHAQAVELLSNHPALAVTQRVDRALADLDKRFIRSWRAQDEFCLTRDERLRLDSELLQLEVRDKSLDNEIRTIVNKHLDSAGVEALEVLGSFNRDTLCDYVRGTLERALLERGEVFAETVIEERLRALDDDLLERTAVQVIRGEGVRDTKRGAVLSALCASAASDVLTSDNPAVASYVRSLAETYTVFSFLRATPDIQKVVRKFFQSGDIWLDTTVVLPLFAETARVEDQRRVTHLLSTAIEAGLSLHVTPGVVEEVERHMNRALTCARFDAGRWEGRVPYLLTAYTLEGRPTAAFPSWLENFRGDYCPEDDLSEYLRDEFSITTVPLDAEMAQVSDELRIAVQEIWFEAHDYRRANTTAIVIDQDTIHRLVEHDVENYLGVVQRRRTESRSEIGYTSWWLTLDHVAYTVLDKLDRPLARLVKAPPIMSPDFLASYLAVSPTRDRTQDASLALPMIVDACSLELVPPEFIAAADEIRGRLVGLPESVIHRKTRDELDRARHRMGPLTAEGIRAFERLYAGA